MITTAGATNKSIYFYIVGDASHASPGEPVTGLLYSDIETGGSASYARQGAARVDLTLITLASASAAHSDGGFILVDDTNMPGVYRCDYPDAAWVTGVDQVVLSLVVAAANNAVAAPILIDLTDADFRDATAWPNFILQYDGTGLSGGTFPSTQDQLGGIANVGSAIHRPADSYTLTTGTQSANLYTDTQALDETRHEHTDDTGAMDLYYEFNVGSGVPSSVQVTGYVTGNNDDLDVYGYDWVTTAWVQIGNMQGTNSASNFVRSYDMFVNMVGTASNLGIVRVRFYKVSGLTTATLAVDQIFMAFSQSASGYENGSIWINSAASNTGTTPRIDGVATNAVSTIGAAKTLSASTNLTDFHVINGTSLTLAANSDNESYFGDNWVLALGGQSCVDIQVEGASVSGIGTAASGEMHFDGCDINTSSVQTGHFDFCGITGPVTHTLASDYNYHNCYSKIAGEAAPVFNKTAGQTVTVEYRNWSGGITLNGLESGDVITIGGRMGTITLNGADATVEIRGTYKAIVNNLTGSPTVNVDGAVLASDVVDTKTLVGNIATGTAAIGTNATGAVITTGTPTLTYTATHAKDGIVHEVAAAGGVTDLYYTVTLPSDAVLSSMKWAGYVNSKDDLLELQFYDWVTTAYVTEKTIVGTDTTTVKEEIISTVLSYTGTGANLGEVRFRLLSATTTNVATDRIIFEYAVVPVSSQTKGAVSDASPTTTGFDTDLTTGTGIWDDARLEFTSGSNLGTNRTITTYVSTAGAVTFDEAFPFTVADTDTFVINHDHVHPVTQIQSGLSTLVATDIVSDGTAINTSAGVVDQVTLTDTCTTNTDAPTDPYGIIKNTNFLNFEFPMVLTSDHYTAATGKTVTGEMSLDGANFTGIASTISELGSGMYKIATLLAADCNADTVSYKFSATDCDDTLIPTIITRT